MADEKEVTVKIMTEVDDADVSDLEDRLEELNNNQLEVDVTSDSSEVDNVDSSVEDLLVYRLQVWSNWWILLEILMILGTVLG